MASARYTGGVYTAHFYMFPHASMPAAGAAAVVVEVSAAGAVRAVAADGREATGVLPQPGLQRLLAYADECDFDNLGSCVGVGAAWMALTIGAKKLAIRHRGAPGSLSPGAWVGLPRAKPILIDLMAEIAAAALAGALSRFVSRLPALPARISKLGLLMRAQISFTSGRSLEQPWIALYENGAIERWDLTDARKGTGSCTMRANVGAGRAQTIGLLALEVLNLAPSEQGIGHDPTDVLTLIVPNAGKEQSVMFAWGRASRNDAPLNPVVGEAASAKFAAFLAAFEALDDELTRASAIPMRGAATSISAAAHSLGARAVAAAERLKHAWPFNTDAQAAAPAVPAPAAASVSKPAQPAVASGQLTELQKRSLWLLDPQTYAHHRPASEPEPKPKPPANSSN